MAAEVVAGAWAVEEVVSTAAQAGVAAYMVSKPTMPLKATLTQIATASDDSTRLSLARSNHTLTVVHEKAYIFGGETAHGMLATNDIHTLTLATSGRRDSDYAILPAIATEKDGDVPAARSRHAACSSNACVAVFGGCDEHGDVIVEDSTIWLYKTAKSAWEQFRAMNADSAPEARADAKLFDRNGDLVLYGGHSADGSALKDVWLFDHVAQTWNQLPSAPVGTSNAVLANGTLYLISSSDTMSSELHTLEVDHKREQQAQWHTLSFPTNPLTPGPRARARAGLLPVTTGYGRNYLLYFFGSRQNAATGIVSDPNETDEPTHWSDIWTFQIPSSEAELKATVNISEAIKPARIKDAIRSKFGSDTGGYSWAEVEVVPPTDLQLPEGKVHPGPRGAFGCDVMEDGRSVVLWGGENAKGERVGDGWIVKLE